MENVEFSIIQIAGEFARELQKLRTKMSRDYGHDTIQLTVGFDGEKPKVELACSLGYGNSVKAATLGALMDEVYRRQGFDDRQAGELQAASDALIALPAPRKATF